MSGPGSVPRVWIFHHRLFHYRLPFWDRLVEQGRGQFSLHCFGAMAGDEAIGGGRRDYLTHMPVGGGVGPVGYTFQGAARMIRREQPEVVMVLLNPRNRLSYQIPPLCRPYGGATIAWSVVHSKSRVPAPALRWLKQRAYLPYDLAFTYGPESSRELADLGFDPQAIYTAHNTIDTSRIVLQGQTLREEGRELRRRHGLEGKRVLLCIAKMYPQKRHEDLLAAWMRLRELDPSLVLVLAGDGPLADEIRRRAEEIDRERIVFLGRIPAGDDYRWMATADVNIQCGAVGLAVNQSMAAGTPTVIADEAGSDAEIVKHDITGWRYAKGDVEALVRTVHGVLTDEPTRTRITAEAMRFTREEASIERMVGTAYDCITRAISLWQERQRAPGRIAAAARTRMREEPSPQ